MTSFRELLDNKESLRVMALLPSQNELSIERMSLFERFSLICENLYLLENNFLGKSFARTVKEKIALSLPLNISMSRELQKKIWRALCAYDSCIEVDREAMKIENYSPCYVELDKCVDIEKRILLSQRKYLDDFIDELVQTDIFGVYYDQSQRKYIRPDPYHAALAYQKAKNNDYTQDDISLLVAWVLCKALEQKNVEVFVGVGDETREALKLVELLLSRKIESSVCICAEDSVACHTAQKCFEADLPNINLGLLSKSEKTLADCATYLPMNRIKFCKE